MTTPSSSDLAQQLALSQSATIYADLGDLDQAAADAMLLGKDALTQSMTTPAAPSSSDLAQQLALSQSATIYADLGDLDQAAADAMLLGKDALKLEHDLVRGLWAVRKASDGEIAEAEAAAEASTPAPAPKPAASSSSSSSTAD